VDAAWTVTYVGGEPTALPPADGEAKTVRLRAGQSLTYRLTVEPSQAAALGQPGIYHFFVERVGSTVVGSNRVEVRIEDRGRGA
jgi:hypothetical protein